MWHYAEKSFAKKVFAVFMMGFFVFTSPFGAISQVFAREDSDKPFVAVLCYHHISDIETSTGTDSNAVVPLSEFEEHMAYLYEQGYYTASQGELQDFIYLNKPLPKKTVVITFDDGYKSNYTNAFPVLKKYGFKATIFVIGERIVEEEGEFEPGILPKLSYGEMKEMVESGLIEFGNHTFDAHTFDGAKPILLNMSKGDIEEDFLRLEELFLKIGIPPFISIAYPYGSFDRDVIDVVKKTKHKLGYTVKKGFVYQDSSPFTLNRLVITPGVSRDDFKLLLKDDSLGLPTGFESSVILCIGSNTAYVKGRPQLLDATPFISGGRTMIPLRFLAQELGGDIHWNPESGKISLTTSETSIDLETGDTSLVMLNGRVMVPLRFLSETLDFKVHWHKDKNMVEIRK